MRKFLGIFLSLVLLVVVLGACGGSGSAFPKTYEGKYFTVGYPDGFTAEGEDDGVVLSRDKDFAVNIKANKDPGVKEGDFESIKMYKEMIEKEVEEEKTMKLDINEMKIDGINSYFLNAVDNEKKQGGIALIVPLDGAVLISLTDDLIKLEDMKLAEDIIKSIKFTNKAYFKEPAKDEKEPEPGKDEGTEKEGEVSGDAFTYDGISVVPAPGWTPKTDMKMLSLQKSMMETVTIVKTPGVSAEESVATMKKGFESSKDPLPVTEDKVTVGDKEFYSLKMSMMGFTMQYLFADYSGTTVFITLTTELTDEVKGMIESIKLE